MANPPGYSPPPYATASVAGVVSTTTQTFGGKKSFSDILGLPLIATGSLPAAASYEGFLAYDSTLNKFVYSDGSAWIDPSGGGGMSIGGTVTSGTTGSLLFVGSGPVLAQDNSNLFWDDTNNYLGLGTATPASRLQITGPTVTTQANNFVSGLYVDGAYTKDDSNTRQFYVERIRPEFNWGGSNANTTVDVLRIDPVYTSGTATVNLIQAYGAAGATRLKLDDADKFSVGPNDATTAIPMRFSDSGSSDFWGFAKGASNVVPYVFSYYSTGKAAALYSASAGSGLMWDNSGTFSFGSESTAIHNGAAGATQTIRAGFNSSGDFFTGSTLGDGIVYDYADQNVGIGTGTITAGHKLTVNGKANFADILGLAKIATGSLPAAASYEGYIVYDDTTSTFKFSNGSAWLDTSASTSISIGNTVTSGTAGSVLFVGAGPILAQDNANLFWDDSNNRLGIGNAAPTVALDVTGAIAASGNITGANLSGTNTGDVTLAAVGASPNANGASLTGQALTLQPADATNPGVVTTGAQTLAGDKTFSGKTAFSDILGLAKIATGSLPAAASYEGYIVYDDTTNKFMYSDGSAWVDPSAGGGGMSIGGTVTSGTTGSLLFVGSGPVLAQDNSNLFWDNTNNYLGLGTATPATVLDVVGATVNAQANNFVSALQLAGTYTKNDSNTRQFYTSVIKPTFNFGGSNTNTTVDLLSIDSTNTAVTGLTANLIKASYGGTLRATLTSGGLFGLGNFTPTLPFRIDGAAQSRFYFANGFSSQNPSATVDNPSGKTVALASGTGGSSIIYDNSGTFAFVSDAAATIRAGTLGNSGTVRMAFTAGGDAYFGTAAGNNLYVDNANNRVGIGSSTLSQGKLWINSSSSGATTDMIWLVNPNNTTNSAVRIAFNNDSTTDSTPQAALDCINTAGNFQSAFSFKQWDGSAFTESVRFNPARDTTFTGATVTTAATNYVSGITLNSTYTKNDSNTRQFYVQQIKPTFNFGGSNAATTVDILSIDSTNTAVSGLTANLINASYGGTSKLLLAAGGLLTTTGATINADADLTIASQNNTATFTKNNSNTRQFFVNQIKPTFNFGGSNANTTVDILNIDTTNTAVTGLTANLINARYGGTSQFKVSSGGVVTTVGEVTVGNSLVQSGNNQAMEMKGWAADSSGAIGVKVIAAQSLTTNGAVIANFYNAATIKAGISKEGAYNPDFTDDSATTGDRTVNKPAGINAFAAAATTITITNSVCKATSMVMAVLQTNDATAQIKNVVPSAGSFTINLSAAATADCKVAWTVTNGN